MLSIPVFGKKRQSNRLMDTPRCDGYTQSAARIVCLFQAYVEAEPDCDYAALAAALLWARTTQFPVTLYTLRAAYNDSRYSSSGYASVKGS